MCLFDNHIIFVMKCPFKSSAHFLFFIIELLIVHIFWIQVLIEFVFCKYFLQVCNLSFSLSDLQTKELLNFNEVQFINVFFYGSFFVCPIFKKCLTYNYKLSFTISNRSFTVLGFIFRCMIHLGLIFINDVKYGSEFIYSYMDAWLF